MPGAWRRVEAVCCALAWCVVLAVSLAGAGVARAQAVAAAGSGERLWVVLPSQGAEGVLAHRGPGDEPGEVYLVRKLGAALAPGGMAAEGAWVYLAYRDLRMQRVRARRDALDQRWVFDSQVVFPLPGGADLLGLAVVGPAPWALVRFETAEALARAEAASAEGAGEPEPREPPGADRGEASEPPSAEGAAEGKADAGAEGPQVSPPPSARAPEAGDDAGGFVPTDRLLRLERGRWRVVALPEGWPSRAWATVVGLGDNGERPVLLARPGGAGAATLRVYRFGDGGWREARLALKSAEQPAAVGVGGQLVVAQRTGGGGSVSLAVVRQDQRYELGEVSLGAGAQGAWALAGSASAATVLTPDPAAARDDTPAPAEGEPPAARVLAWSVTLDGEVDTEPRVLTLAPPRPLARAADYIVLVTVLALSTLMMVLFWQRNPAQHRLDLPGSLQLAELPRRLAAGAIDLAPGVGAAVVGFGLSPQELLLRWPGVTQAAEWSTLAPAGLAIGLFVLHTTASELVWGRTLGKAALGLRVVTMRGGRPAAWRVVLRGGLKSFDLVAWLLLVLPLVGPFRQRLGDMMAGTVVVQTAEGDDQRDEDPTPGDQEP